MPDSHPYISGPGNIAQLVTQLRKAFPATVTSATVKKLGLAPNNESSLINAINFIGIINGEGNKTEQASKVFSLHKDEDFSPAFEQLVENAYSALFDLHGNESWQLEEDALITFFRQSDQTSDAIGKRQAKTFKVFAALSGHGEVPALRGSGNKSEKTQKATKSQKPKAKPKSSKEASQQPPTVNIPNSSGGNLGLTVRVEINLPADGSKETYDHIFKSIKENLLNG